MRRCGDAALTQVCNPREREPSTSRSRHGERATEVEMPRGDWEPVGAMTNAWARREARNGGEARQFRHESSVFQIRSITQEYSSACRSLGASSLSVFSRPRSGMLEPAGLGCGILPSALLARRHCRRSSSAKPLARSRRCSGPLLAIVTLLAPWHVGKPPWLKAKAKSKKCTDALTVYARRVAGMA